MDRFVIEKNIEHYRELLTTVTDAAQRRVIRQLLAEEEARIFAPSPPPEGDGAAA